MHSPSLIFLLLFLAAILTLHVLSVVEEWYVTIDWIDIPLHVAGGMWVALVFLYVQERYAPGLPTVVPWWMNILLIAGFVMLVGVMWEWLEYGFDLFFAQDRASWRAQLGLPDTMGDLFADLMGGIAVGLYFLLRKGNSSGGKN